MAGCTFQPVTNQGFFAKSRGMGMGMGMGRGGSREDEDGNEGGEGRDGGGGGGSRFDRLHELHEQKLARQARMLEEKRAKQEAEEMEGCTFVPGVASAAPAGSAIVRGDAAKDGQELPNGYGYAPQGTMSLESEISMDTALRAA